MVGECEERLKRHDTRAVALLRMKRREAFLFTKGTSNTLLASAELTTLEAKDRSKQYCIISNNNKSGHLSVADVKVK